MFAELRQQIAAIVDDALSRADGDPFEYADRVMALEGIEEMYVAWQREDSYSDIFDGPE